MSDSLFEEVPGREVLSIAAFYDQVTAALDAAFPARGDLWVRGEVQKYTESRGHAYIDLIDPDETGARTPSVLNVKCWQRTWAPLKRELADSGLVLAPGMTVSIRGQVDLYKARGSLSLVLQELDVTALLGRLAKERQALLDALTAEGLLDAQRLLDLPVVPLRIGLVASPGTEGCNDFLGQLLSSGFGFEVTMARALVQGDRAPAEVAGAVAALDAMDLDVICVVRGGGSKADLATFDTATVARAIATCSTPVLTGIGHTGDESIADLVARERHITPPACGQSLVARVADYWSHVAGSASRVAQRSVEIVDARQRAYGQLRGQLTAEARSHVRGRLHEVTEVRRRLTHGPTQAIDRSRRLLVQVATRLPASASGAVARAQAQNEGRRALLSAYDPTRLLARGWSLTTSGDGSPVRSITQLDDDATIITRVLDGTITSTVTATTPATEGAPSP